VPQPAGRPDKESPALSAGDDLAAKGLSRRPAL